MQFLQFVMFLVIIASHENYLMSVRMVTRPLFPFRLRGVLHEITIILDFNIIDLDWSPLFLQV